MSPDAGLTPVQIQAAVLVAQDKLSNEKIAEKCGISKRTLQLWKQDKAFSSEVKKHRDAWSAKVLSRGIADAAQCVDLCESLQLKLRLLMQARANDPLTKDLPGGDTGLLVITEFEQVWDKKQQKYVPAPKKYKFDRAVLAEIREMQQHVARLTGKWQEKLEITSVERTEIFMGWDLRAFGSLSLQEFEQLKQISERLATAGGAQSGGGMAEQEQIPAVLPGPGTAETRALPEAPPVL
jgi:transcriptional regulator with XRE-family HTH domain